MSKLHLQFDNAAPWLKPYRKAGALADSCFEAGMKVPDTLNRLGCSAVQFVAQCELPAGKAYEAFIFETATVPTRDNLHDFFNGLCWLKFPLAKAKLNALQAAQIATAGVRPVRGPVRDALTLFDENAALLSAPPALWDALLARDWKRLFIELRPLWADAQLVLFGHALLEKLVSPRKPITAHVYRAPLAIDSIASLDFWLAEDLSADKLAAKPFSPLPVLGVPGWWAENENFSFYDDSQVFRPHR